MNRQISWNPENIYLVNQSRHHKVEHLNRGLIIFFIVIITAIFLSFLPAKATTQSSKAFETSNVNILFDPGIGDGAIKVAKIYNEIKADIQDLFGLSYNHKTLIVLINNRERFLQSADHPITIAYAIPQRNLIVIDYSRVVTTPFSLETTLTHEFCHLLLHEHIPDIPRWLDEGLCQWASGGFDEIIYNFRHSALNQASITGKFIPFNSLNSGFPRSEQKRVLAYEQSKSFITYLIQRFGEEKLLEFLDQMVRGEIAEEAFHKVYGIRLYEIEIFWQESLRKDLAWVTYLSTHLYELLFIAGALLTIFGFFKLIRKKRNYKDDDFDD